jgi:hypothetical protein
MATGFLTSHLSAATNPIQATLEHLAALRLCARIIFSLFLVVLSGLKAVVRYSLLVCRTVEWSMQSVWRQPISVD